MEYLLTAPTRSFLHITHQSFSHLQAKKETGETSDNTPSRSKSLTSWCRVIRVLGHARAKVVLPALGKSDGSLNALASAKDSNVLDDAVGRVTKVTAHAEGTVVEGEVDH